MTPYQIRVTYPDGRTEVLWPKSQTEFVEEIESLAYMVLSGEVSCFTPFASPQPDDNVEPTPIC